MVLMKEYTIAMSWDSYEGSLFRETQTTWKTAYSEEDARRQAVEEFGHNEGFIIEFVNC